MNKFVNIKLLATIFGIAIWTPSLGQTACLSQQELLAIELPSQELVTPCDEFGASYLIGLGNRREGLRLRPLTTNYQRTQTDNNYFYFAKSYLNLVYGDVNVYETSGTVDNQVAGDALGFLIGILVTLPNVSEEGQSANQKRFDLYRAFAILEYRRWMGRLERDRGYNEFETGEISGQLTDYMFTFSESVGFQRFGDVTCFMIFDLPAFSVEEIMNSKNYQNCTSDI